MERARLLSKPRTPSNSEWCLTCRSGAGIVSLEECLNVDTCVMAIGAEMPHPHEKLAEWMDTLGSTQVTSRSDGEPAVTQVAAAVKEVH